MKLSIKALILILLFLMVGSLTAHGQQWKTIKKLQGSEDIQTESFNPSSDTWRIVWESSIRNKPSSQGPASFTTFDLYVTGPNRYPGRKIASAGSYHASDTNYIYNSKKHQVRINTVNRTYRVLIQVKAGS